jgi:hypothetical protein
VTRFLERNTATLTPQLRKIESDFRSPHHEFPKDFLAQLEKDIHAEIASGPLGLFFGAENITILCNSISAN